MMCPPDWDNDPLQLVSAAARDGNADAQAALERRMDKVTPSA